MKPANTAATCFRNSPDPQPNQRRSRSHSHRHATSKSRPLSPARVADPAARFLRVVATASCVALVWAATISTATATPDVLGSGDTTAAEAANDAATQRYNDPSHWRYTAEGWKHIDELRVVRTPREPWLLSACHPMVVASLLIMAACLLLALDAQSPKQSRPTGNSMADDVKLDHVTRSNVQQGNVNRSELS